MHFSHLSRTRFGAKMSLPGWSMERHISPTISTSIQQLSKSRTWSYRLSSMKPGERKRLWDTPTLFLSSLFLYKQKSKFSKAFKTQTIRKQSYFKDMVICWHKEENFELMVHNSVSSPGPLLEVTYISFRIYKGLLPGHIQLPRQMLVKYRKLEPIFMSYILIIAPHCCQPERLPVWPWPWLGLRGGGACRENGTSLCRKSRLQLKGFFWLLKISHPVLESLFSMWKHWL